MATTGPRLTVLDRVIGAIAPRAAVNRARARMQLELVGRATSFYEAAAVGRRTESWHRVGIDANAAIGPSLSVLRAKARHMVANNPYAESALDTLSTHIAGPYGIIAKPANKNKRVAEAWSRWSDSTQCDADGVNDFAGLQDLAIRTFVESGEVIIRRRRRRVEDGLSIPLQIQVVEPDLLDTGKTIELRTGGRIIQGVEFDAIGRRVAYWMFRDHPGASLRASSIIGTSVRVPASEVQHVFRSTRAGQARAVTWFAPVLLKLSDFDEFDDASLMKQKIAACLAVFTRDVDGAGGLPIGKGPSEKLNDPLVDMLEPGMVTRLNPGEDISVVTPPATTEYGDFAKSQLRAIATGIGVTYEDLTGDYTGMPFSAARMSRQRHWQKVERWRWRIVIPRMCAPVWQWFLEAALLAGEIGPEDMQPAEWVTPPPAMIDPDKEVAAYRRRIRAGLISPQDAIRELGLDPEEVLADIQTWNKLLDKLGIVLDSDPRQMSEAGQRHSAGAAASADKDEAKPSKAADKDDDEETSE